MSTKKKQLESIAQAAIADADSLSAVYQEVFASRLSANLEAIGANVVGSIAQQHAKLSLKITNQVAKAYAQEAETTAVEVIDLPLPKVRLDPCNMERVDVDELMPTPDKPKLKLA